MFPGALLLFLIHAVSGHTGAPIFRYVSYTGCDTVTGSVTVHAASGVQQMILNLRSLPPNATGFIQVRDGVNCFESNAGELYMGHAEDTFPFEANVSGVVSNTLDFGNVTVDEMMGRTVHVLLGDDNSTTRIACGTVGLSYPSTVGAYPGAAAQVEGTIAVTGPLKAEFGEGAHGPTKLQLAFDLANLEPGVTGRLEVHSGNSCNTEAAVGTLWGTNWTTATYTADANGVAVGYADITWVSSLRNLSEYYGRVVVVRDSNDAPVACGVLACPEGTVEETDAAGARRGFCRPAVSWAFSHVIAADLYSHSSPVQVQVSGAAFELAYSEVRSIPTCAATGNSVTTTFFVKNGGSVDQLVAGQFEPVTGVKQVVVLGDKQPVSVGRQDNYVNVSFAQSAQNNTHDVVHLAVGVSDLIFHVAAPGHRQETRLTFGSKSTIAFPTGAVPTNTTVWITDAATKAVIYQKGFLFGKPSPNFVWFLYGWDSAAADCSSGQRNCTDFPVAVTTYPEIRGDYGDGVIPPVESGSLATCVPGFLVLALTALVF